MVQINRGFKHYSDSNLAVKAEFILVSMTGNANFANPEPPLAEVRTGLNAFNEALAASKTRSTELVAIKNEKRAVLDSLLTKLGLWVQLNGNDNEAILKSSGFDVARKRAPLGVLPKPKKFVAKPGDARGTVKLSMERIHGADSYVFEYAQAPVQPGSKWESMMLSRSSALVSNLSSGQSYVFKAVAVGASPVRVYSDEVSTYVL